MQLRFHSCKLRIQKKFLLSCPECLIGMFSCAGIYGGLISVIFFNQLTLAYLEYVIMLFMCDLLAVAGVMHVCV